MANNGGRQGGGGGNSGSEHVEFTVKVSTHTARSAIVKFHRWDQNPCDPFPLAYIYLHYCTHLLFVPEKGRGRFVLGWF